MRQANHEEAASQNLDAAHVFEEISALKTRLSKGIELLARLASRSDPNTRTKAEEPIAEWVRREIPR